MPLANNVCTAIQPSTPLGTCNFQFSSFTFNCDLALVYLFKNIMENGSLWRQLCGCLFRFQLPYGAWKVAIL